MNHIDKNLLPFSLDTAQELLAIYGSPLYVYRLDQLIETIDYITNSISYADRQFQFASVTNGNVALLQIFKNHGWGIHANTPHPLTDAAIVLSHTLSKPIYHSDTIQQRIETYKRAKIPVAKKIGQIPQLLKKLGSRTQP